MRAIPVELQFFSLVVTVAVGLLSLAFSFKKVLEYFRSKGSVARLEKIVAEHDDWLRTDNLRLKALEEEMKKSIEDRKDIHENERLLLVAVQAILSGDPTEEKDAQKQIQTYLSKQI